MNDLFAIAFWFLATVIGGVAEALVALIILCGLLNILAIIACSCLLVGSAIVSPIIDAFRNDDTQESRQ